MHTCIWPSILILLLCFFAYYQGLDEYVCQSETIDMLADIMDLHCTVAMNSQMAI